MGFAALITFFRGQKEHLSGNSELWPMALAFEFHKGRVKVNQHAKCLGQQLFRQEVIVHTDTRTHSTECRNCTTKVWWLVNCVAECLCDGTPVSEPCKTG